MAVRERIQQRRFQSLAAEAVISLLVAADHVDQAVAPVWEQHGITADQYNVLRILRGAAPERLPSSEIGRRLVARDPDITRLLDRLEQRGLVTRLRDAEDRRVVRARITEKGLELLSSLDEPVEQALAGLLGHLGEKKLRTLSALLEEARRKV